LVGVCAGLAGWRRNHQSTPGRGAWVTFAAYLGIVAMLGSGGPKVDVSAHLFGLAVGALTGLLLAVPFASPPTPNRVVQALAMFAAIGIIALAWARALV
jgi:membrane associated rhomboid family serine protease